MYLKDKHMESTTSYVKGRGGTDRQLWALIAIHQGWWWALFTNIVVDIKLFNDMLVRRDTTSKQGNIHISTHKIQMYLHEIYYFVC